MARVRDQDGVPAAADMENPRGSEELTRRLLDGAVAEFASRGYEAATIADIVRRCGVSTGGVYTRWRDKQEFFLAAVRYALAQRFTNIDSLAAFGTNHLRSADTTAEALIIEACIVARRDASMRRAIAQVLSSETNTLETLIADAKDAGAVDSELSTELLVLCCQALSIGLSLARSTSEDSISHEDRQKWVSLMSRMIEGWAPADD